jgi:Ca-activated chloride channel family protein
VPFLAPLALLGLLFLPAVLAMYLLKLRRDEAVVPSTLLWQRLVADVEANAPWQRLRRSLLLLLQLLLVAILAILAARPFLERPAGLARDLVIVVDTSASMAATDVAPDRLTVAKHLAIDALAGLPADGRVSVIAAGRTARVVVNGTSDLGRVRAAIDGIAVSAGAGVLDDGLRLADALAARSDDAQILVATDMALASQPTFRLTHPVTVLQAGRERGNQAILALALRPNGVSNSAFISVGNLDVRPATRRLEVYGDGDLIEARDVFMDPQTRTQIVIDDIENVAVVEVRLAGSDALAADDRAWAVVPDPGIRRVLVVSEGDPYLATALLYLPKVEVWAVKPAQYGPETHVEKFDLVVFEGWLPASLPPAAVLAIAPPVTSPLGRVTGTVHDPAIGVLPVDEPLLRYVDLSTTHVGTANRLELPAWARAVIPGTAGAPLLYSGQLDGRPAAVLAFLPRDSDLPLQVAFPILVSNLTGELLGGSVAPQEAVVPGDPVTIPLPASAVSITVTRPDGATVTLAPAVPGAASVVFSQTDQVGVYTAVATLADATATPAGSVPPGGTPTPTSAAASPLASPGASPTPRLDPRAPIRFAVDLFDPLESDISPGAAALPQASPAASASATPAPSGAVTGGAETRPPARQELWPPIVIAALLLLTLEWLVYQRDAVIRLWRRWRPA